MNEKLSVNLKEYSPEMSVVKKGIVVKILWYMTNILFFRSYIIPVSSFKVFLLKLFGAKIGKGLVMKPGINIKFPWLLEIGDQVWIGEGVWIDNLGKVTIGNNVCISQGAMLLTGNHNYKKTSFNLIVGPIILEDGVWVGAKSVVCPGVVCRTHSILTVGSIATMSMDSYMIYQGNPAIKVKERLIIK